MQTRLDKKTESWIKPRFWMYDLHSLHGQFSGQKLRLKKFRAKTQIEINDDARETCNTNSQIKFKTFMLRSSLCDYSDVYILVKGTIIVTNTGIAAVPNNRNSKVIFKNYTSFTDCIGEINNTEIDNPRDIAVVMQMYDLTEYSDNCSKTSETI